MTDHSLPLRVSASLRENSASSGLQIPRMGMDGRDVRRDRMPKCTV